MFSSRLCIVNRPVFCIRSGTVRNFVCGEIAGFGNVAQRCATGVAAPVNSLVGACVA